jgi:hypothetical protein
MDRFYCGCICWTDCIVAAQWLSQLYHLKGIIVFVGCVNLLYVSYSFTLANYKKCSLFLIHILVIEIVFSSWFV